MQLELVREGLARIDKKNRYNAAYPNIIRALEKATDEARRTRAGAWEFGDVRQKTSIARFSPPPRPRVSWLIISSAAGFWG
jgi:endonuclease YncB( thermonuclease family)